MNHRTRISIGKNKLSKQLLAGIGRTDGAGCMGMRGSSSRRWVIWATLMVVVFWVGMCSVSHQATAGESVSVSDLESWGLEESQLPDVATLVLSGDLADSEYRNALREAYFAGKAVICLGATPDEVRKAIPELPGRFDSNDTQLSYVLTGSDGMPYLGCIETNVPDLLDARELLWCAARSIMHCRDSSKGIKTTGSSERLVNALEASWYWWVMGAVKERWWTEGWARVTITPGNLRNDGSTTQDYWLAKVLWEVEPGCSLWGTEHRTYETIGKFWKNGTATAINYCTPNDDVVDTTVTLTYGWPPSASITVRVPNVTCDNQSSPSNGYARWVHTYNTSASTARGYHYTETGFGETVPQNHDFQLYNNNTFKWVIPGMPPFYSNTAFPAWTVSIAKPSY